MFLPTAVPPDGATLRRRGGLANGDFADIAPRTVDAPYGLFGHFGVPDLSSSPLFRLVEHLGWSVAV